MVNSAVFLIACPDQKGLVARIANFLYSHNANILHADQHRDASQDLFLMRVEWDLSDFDLSMEECRAAFVPIAEALKMRWKLYDSRKRQRLAIFVSRYEHCLLDLLRRHHHAELDCDIPLIISNHPDAEPIAAFYQIPYYHIPVSATNKTQAFAQILALLHQERIDCVALARYMQIIPPQLIAHYPNAIINVHHSFLPAFSGARPYQRAFDRGVKLIGATSHYVTEELDDGPIIEQEVARISHRDGVEDLVAKGRDLEQLVLARAIRWHLEHRILVYANKTVVFD
jgi:formyltetrahydrofolate deformylase